MRIDTLLRVQAAEGKLNSAGISLRLFTVPIKIDGREYSVDYFEGEDPDDVIMDLLVSVTDAPRHWQVLLKGVV